jgi:deferrochelatase/peroxidase EfeB
VSGKLSRKQLLIAGGAAGAAAAVGGGLVHESRSGAAPAPAATTDRSPTVPFHGVHQAGILTPQQSDLRFASFDFVGQGKSDLHDLLRSWTTAAALLTAGRSLSPPHEDPEKPPADTGEAAGLAPARLTLTFGLGPTVFGKVGLASKKPPQLADIPHFPFDELDPGTSYGDVCIQACADDPQVAFHAIRALTRIGFGHVALRWIQSGFASAPKDGGTKRNLMGFKDGTANPPTSDAAMMQSNVWANAGDGQDWMTNGSYLVSRRIEIHIEVWDTSAETEQDGVFGRHKLSGAPFGGKGEFDPVNIKDIPVKAHIRRANPRQGEATERQRILRRGYNFDEGLDAGFTESVAGLFFLAYQRDPRAQFVPIQARLAAEDRLNEYIQHVSSAVWAVLPGVEHPDGYLGQTLFEA